MKKVEVPMICDICREPVDGKDYHIAKKTIQVTADSEYMFEIAICCDCCINILHCGDVEFHTHS